VKSREIHSCSYTPTRTCFADSFSKDIVDWVAPPPKTKYGNLYLLTNDVFIIFFMSSEIFLELLETQGDMH
jgi:hypothetical protein